MTPTREHYSPFTLTFHWVTAILVLCQPLIVWLSDGLPREEHGQWIMIHKSIGVTLLVLTLIRLSSRVSGHKALPLPDTTPVWQRLAARTTHVLFYVLLIAMPLVGWASSTAAGRAVEYFGLFQLPDLPLIPHDRSLAKALISFHELAGLTLVGLVVLHILGALKHFLIDKDNVLHRMLPIVPRRAA
jgi:cytochrome b561